MLIHIAQIQVNPRIREEKEDSTRTIAELANSIQHHGLLQSIIVSEDGDGAYVLRAGERRLLAIAKLYATGKTFKTLDGNEVQAGYIPVELATELSEESALMLEFEENERRKDFTWQERAKYIKAMHNMMSEKHKKWTLEMTGHLLGVTKALISNYLGLEEAVEKYDEVSKATTMRAAVKRMQTARKMEVRKLEVRNKAPEKVKRAEQMLACADAREWIKQVGNDSVDLINFDPPWGVLESEAGRRGFSKPEEFDDSEEYSTSLVHDLIPELYRVLKPDRFLVLWFGIERVSELLKELESTGFNLSYRAQIPAIWYKPDKLSDFTQQRFPNKKIPIHSYETFYFIRKGDPDFHEQAQDVFLCNRVPKEVRTHTAEKPIELIERIIRLCTVPGELVLDPCAGSASSLVAAYKALRKAVGCESKKAIYDRALTRLAECLS